MPKSTFIPFQCEPSTLDQIATNLIAFAPAMLGTDWLVSAAYLQGTAGLFVASASIEVLADGTVARPLHISPADALLDELREALPDIQHRIAARGFADDLPEPPDRLDPPPMADWFGSHYAADAVIRRIERHEAVHRISCALLFTRGDTGERLLIGTDVTTPALVASHDPELIDSYLADCDVTGIADYRAMVG